MSKEDDEGIPWGTYFLSLLLIASLAKFIFENIG